MMNESRESDQIRSSARDHRESHLGRAPVVVTRPNAAAADASADALFVARSALKRAIAIRASADLQIDQLRALIDRLTAERPAGT